MMRISPIWNAETPVNIAARRTLGASWRAGGGVVGKVCKCSGNCTSSSACQKLPARVPHRLHVPRARQFEAFQCHFCDTLDLGYRLLDTAIGQAGETDLAVGVVAAGIFQPVIA
jgi:hypothetical protein